jgi:hypothetical protein
MDASMAQPHAVRPTDVISSVRRVTSGRMVVCFLYDHASVSDTVVVGAMADSEARTRRKWADIVAIVASVTALGNAMWGPLIFGTRSSSVPTDPGAGYNWLAFGLGGALGLLGLIVAQKRPLPGRVALALGGALLVVVPLFYENRAMLPIVTSVVLGLAMLLSSFFLGPMPAPRGMPEGAVRR